MVQIVFPEGRTISRQGDPGIHCYMILSGKVEASVARPGVMRRDGRMVVANRGPGELVGEVSVLVGSPRSTTLTAVENTTCEVFTKAELMTLLERDPKLAVGCLRDLLEHLQAKNNGHSISNAGRN